MFLNKSLSFNLKVRLGHKRSRVHRSLDRLLKLQTATSDCWVQEPEYLASKAILQLMVFILKSPILAFWMTLEKLSKSL